MNTLPSSRTTLALAMAALVAACGGDSSAPHPSTLTAQEFVARITPDAPRSNRLKIQGVGGGAVGAAATVITNAQLFQWAQLQYPEIFGSVAPTVISNYPYDGKLFDVRDFKNGAYLGVANGRAYGLGPFTGGQLVDFGTVQQYADTVCARINCDSTGGGGGGGGTGTLNGCTLGASEALRAGNRYTAVYISSVFVPSPSTGEYTLEGVVDGTASFEGQSAVRFLSTVRGVQLGQTVDATNKAYLQAAENDLTRTLGNETDASLSGFSLTLRTVFNPAYLNNEFTLQPGQSLNKTTSSTSTYINSPIPFPPSSGSGTVNHTYEARETITVLGRSYDTCRYKDVAAGSDTASYTWYVFGKGIPARQESRNAGGAVLNRNELKSGTLNGAPI